MAHLPLPHGRGGPGRPTTGSGLAEHVVVDSYGTGDWHVGELGRPRTVAALAEHGLDATTHRARVVPPDLLGRSDLILCAEARTSAECDASGVAPVARCASSASLTRPRWPPVAPTSPTRTTGHLEDYRRCYADVAAAACAGLMAELPAVLRGAFGGEATRLP